MPNGWYPVIGLDVVLLNRTEQRYPRMEWDQSWDTFWAVAISGPRGYTPDDPFRLGGKHGDPIFARLTEGVQTLVASDPQLQSVSGSAIAIDFKKRKGWAVGRFFVYAFQEGGVSVLHDHSLAALVPPGTPIDGSFPIHTVQLSHIDAKGIQRHNEPEKLPIEFDFPHAEAIVVSSEALHGDAHWPPKNSLDCVVIALAQQRHGDLLMALWKPEEKTNS